VLVVSVVVRFLMDQSVGCQTAATTSHQSAVSRLPVGLDVPVVVRSRRRLRLDQCDRGAQHRTARLDEQRVEQREAWTRRTRVADDGHSPESHRQERNVLDERAAQHQKPQVSSTSAHGHANSQRDQNFVIQFRDYNALCSYKVVQ